MNKEVYIIVGGEYSDWWIDSYFTDRDKAEKYCIVKNKGKLDDLLRVESVEKNNAKINENITINYKTTIYFKKVNNSWVFRDEIVYDAEAYEGEKKPTTHEVYKGGELLEIYVSNKDFEKSKKIAFDYIASHLKS